MADRPFTLSRYAPVRDRPAPSIDGESATAHVTDLFRSTEPARPPAHCPGRS